MHRRIGDQDGALRSSVVWGRLSAAMLNAQGKAPLHRHCTRSVARQRLRVSGVAMPHWGRQAILMRGSHFLHCKGQGIKTRTVIRGHRRHLLESAGPPSRPQEDTTSGKASGPRESKISIRPPRSPIKSPHHLSRGSHYTCKKEKVVTIIFRGYVTLLYVLRPLGSPRDPVTGRTPQLRFDSSL